MSIKGFKLVDSGSLAPSSSKEGFPHTNWKLCMICQEEKAEVLTSPVQLKRKNIRSGYISLAKNLTEFQNLGQLPFHLERLDEGHGIEETMVKNSAVYHHSCKLRYNNTKLERAQKRSLQTNNESENLSNVSKRTRSQSSANRIEKAKCFFCEKSDGTGDLHEVTTLEMDKRVRDSAVYLEDTELLAKLSPGDMVALEAKYHTKCLVGLYNRVRTAKNKVCRGADKREIMEGIVFAELVMYIEEAVLDEETAPVFKLADIAQLYMSRMEQLGIILDTRVHTTRLKDRLLAHFPDMRAQKKGRDILLAFEDDISNALAKACAFDKDRDAVHLARAAQIVRRNMFEDSKPFTGFQAGCQQDSVPPTLLALVNMILEGPSISDQIKEQTPATLSIAQLLKFNSVKHKRGILKPSSVRNSTAQETPVPVYTGLMLHSQTRNKELIDRLSHLGMSISYNRVLRLSAQIANSICNLYQREQVVCPPKLRGRVFTSAAVDNIDHNPSSTTSRESFHGTGISLIQHPRFDGEGIDRTIVIDKESADSHSKSLNHLPLFYADVFSVTSSIKNQPVPSTIVTTLNRDGLKQYVNEEYLWLDHVRKVLKNDPCESETIDNTTWAAYHSSQQPQTDLPTCTSALLPLFSESAHTVAMVRHSMDVIWRAVEYLNPGQTPVIAFDQPLYAMAKEIQWKWPEKYGEHRIVIMFGGLHIEMAALKILGDWLQGSGWVQALIQADIATPGIADSFLHASHVSRTRRAHEVTVSALYILQQQAYDSYRLTCSDEGNGILEFKDWCKHRAQSCPHFQYWSIVTELELCVLTFVRSLRLRSFPMYLDALTELATWFHALDHTNYARWIPVHLRDMAELPTKHPEINQEFNDGNFTVQKTKRVFSAIPIDQAHEQNNAYIKDDGGAIGLTNNPQALLRWMISGPEIARLIQEFQDEQPNRRGSEDTRHHDQTPSIQASFAKDVRSLVCVINDLGNPFEELSKDLLVLDTKELADQSAVSVVQCIKRVGIDKFTEFCKERLINRSRQIDDIIHRNKLSLFKNTGSLKSSKKKEDVTLLKCDVALFSRLYIGCQNRQGNLREFFRHENQPCPPSLSDGCNIHLGTKSDLLQCLEEYDEEQSEPPLTSCVILHGSVVVQMLRPGTAKTIEDYAHQNFIPYISSQFLNASRVDLVWDKYIDNSLKGTARAKRGKGVRRRVTAESTVPRSWQDFLRVDSNKTELYRFLSRSLIRTFEEGVNQIVVTDGEYVLSNPQIQDVDSISPCNHEEADSRMLLHAAHASRQGHNRILICTVDTDVVVLAVSVVQSLNAETELWIAFGTGKNFRHLAAHEIARGLGPRKALALPMFHALTGCDTVSSFVGHGKKTAWKTWKALPELTDALVKLVCAPTNIPSEVIQTIERFVILLYDRTSTCYDINQARQKIFARKPDVKLIPPTRAALEEHVKRATYQGGHVWGQLLQPNPSLPSPIEWGWILTDGLYEPQWTTLPEASKVCYELIRGNLT